MEVKIDTKEKFTVVTPNLTELSDIIAADWIPACREQLLKEVKNVVLNLQQVSIIVPGAAKSLVELQQVFYETNASFVICNLQEPVEKFLDKMDVLEMLNVTPTESEAWDIVQMEEIERELLDSNNVEFPGSDD